jgi:mono/diheme cytochrome c family protein
MLVRWRLLGLLAIAAAVLAGAGAAWLVWNDGMPGRRELVLRIPPGAGTEAGGALTGIPDVIRVRVGDVVLFKNEDSVTHRVGGLSIRPGSTATQGFREPGKVVSACTAHPAGNVTYEIEPPLSYDGFWAMELGLAGLLVGGSAFTVGPRHRRGKAVLVATGTAVILAGLVLVVSPSSSSDPAPRRGPVINPIPASPSSVAVGKTVYLRFCESCHGTSGRGDGPVASSIAVPTADLRLHIPIHPDDYLLATINSGIPDVNMPALERTLTEEEKWHLINYLRALADKTS